MWHSLSYYLSCAANTEENRETRRQDNRSPERYPNPELRSKKTRVLDSRLLNSALCQPNTKGYSDAPTVCRSCTLLIMAINCGINPTAKQGGLGGQGLEHRSATRRNNQLTLSR
jgi:hypothetical protein